MARVSSSAGGLFGFGQHPEGWPIGFPALTFSVPSWQELVLFAKYDVERAVWLEIDCLFIYFLLLIPNLDVSKNGGFPPQIIHFNRVFNYKPSILGYLYFWKHPIVFCCSHGCFLERLELFCFDVLLGCFFFLRFDILVGMCLSFIPSLLGWKIWPGFFSCVHDASVYFYVQWWMESSSYLLTFHCHVSLAEGT